MRYREMRTALASTVAAYAIVMAAPALAQTKSFNVPEQAASTGIPELARQADIQILVSESAARGKTTRAVRGNMSVEAALQRLLRGTGLRVSSSDGRTITLSAGPAPTRGEVTAGSAAANSESAEIVVTGTRIDSAESASPVIRLDADAIKMSGLTDLGQALRSLPQSFGGGQNPGVLSGVVGAKNINLSSGSSANLRGLGGDATLTLLNGHRLSYGSVVQAVDLSAIPLAAVDRVEIVADGASAIYGTDAVGGVVNIVLKRNYEGVSVSSTIGGATDGGDFQQQYNLVAGKSWGSGNVMVAFNYDHNSEVDASDRDYTAYMPDGNTLFPRISQRSAILTLKQDISSNVEFSLEATYNRRTSFQSYAESPEYVYENTPKNTSYSLTPSLRINLGTGWDLHLSGTYGRDRTKFDQAWISNGITMSHIRGCYCNELASAEVYASGRVAEINGNSVKVVAGGGYRYNRHESIRYTATSPDSDGSVDSYYGFTEASIPIFGPQQEIPFINKLEFNAALRFEHYPKVASVAVPKLGVIYGISDEIELKGTWGKSFKAPSLNDQFATNYSYLYPANFFGGERFPEGSTLIVDTGGSSDLKPEKATSWSATAVFRPRVIEGLRLQATYFNVDYKDRVIQPVAGTAIFRALSDASFLDFVTYNPSQESIDSVIANSLQFYNYSGSSQVDNVVAILHDRNTNAVRQHIEGVDLSVDYRFDINPKSSIILNANGAWLWSKQELTSGAGWMQLAGTIFNPARFKARASVGWTDGASAAVVYINHIAGITDNRTEPYTQLSQQTTFDISLRYKLPTTLGTLSGTTLALNAQNLFNKRPPYAAPSGGYAYYASYDSTNFSAIGRFVSFTISKDF